MKKRMYLFIVLFVGTAGLYAQSCSTGFCPSTILVHHKAGDLSPIGADITYNVVKVGTLCWIAQNLGAAAAPAAFGNYGGGYDGWSYQAGLKQGYVNSSSMALAYFTTWPSTWPSTTDPCTLTFGSVWRLPTSAEYTSSYNSTWSASIQPNLDGTLYYNNSGTITYFTGPGTSSTYWISDLGSGTAPGREVIGSNSYGPWSVAYMAAGPYITAGIPVRCVKKVTD
jgi:hypothetical protein